MKWGAHFSAGSRAWGNWKQGRGQVVLRIHPLTFLSYSFSFPADQVQELARLEAKCSGLGPKKLQVRWGGADPRPAHKGLRR